MSIRSNALPVGRDLAPELQEILRKNGMQAHIIRQGEGYQLAVQGHDSPLLTYAITAQQHRALVDWGANSANKQAYNTVAELVKNDFYMPRDFVHARNANGRVAMGLHGYRIGVGEYGRLPWNKRHAHMMMDPYHGRFLGWTPRCQEGFHMRRVGGAMFMQGAPIVPERPDGRMKPGELQNGGYGFYYIRWSAKHGTTTIAGCVGRPAICHYPCSGSSTSPGTSQTIQRAHHLQGLFQQ